MRFAFRLWLGFAAILILATSVYALVRSHPGFNNAPTPPALVTQQNATSQSSLADWVMEGGNPARTRARSESITLPINRRREVSITEDEGSGSPLAIAQNTILVEAKDRLRALDLRTGRERWSFPEIGRYISPAVAGNTVFIRAEADNQGQIIALDLLTGAQRWAFRPLRLSSAETSYWGGHLTSPVIAAGVVFVGAGKELYALNAVTGAASWVYTASDYLSSSATIGEGRIFFSDARHLYAIDQHSGKLAWKSDTLFSPYFSPIVASQTVFLTNGDKVLALNTMDGTKRWELGYQGETLIPGAVQGSRLFVKSTTTLYALDIGTGQELWRFEQPNFVSFPVVAGAQLFAVTGMSGQTSVAVIDVTTGKQVGDQPDPTLALASPVLAGQTLFVRTTDGRVLGLSN